MILFDIIFLLNRQNRQLIGERRRFRGLAFVASCETISALLAVQRRPKTTRAIARAYIAIRTAAPPTLSRSSLIIFLFLVRWKSLDWSGRK